MIEDVILENEWPTMQQPSFHPRNDPRPDIENALDRAIALSTGSRRYPVTHGQFVHEKYRRYRYAFVLQASWDLPDGTDLQLISSDFDQPLLVQLCSTKDDTIIIAVTQRLPEQTLASAQLVMDHAYLLRKMKDALHQPATSAQLGLKLFGHLDCPDEKAASSLVEMIGDVFVPDEAQRLAIQRALASELLMILGPPGSGKTDVLATVALLHTLLYKHRVLITSHTNIAIDTAILRLINFFRKQGMASFIEEQSVIRFGDPHLTALETDEYRTVTLASIVNDRLGPQQEAIVQLERRLEEVQRQQISDEKEVQQQRQAWEKRQATLPRELKRAKSDLKELEAEEQRRLTPILEQLTPLIVQDEQAKREMDQVLERLRTDEESLHSLQQAYQRQLAPYLAEREKLERLHKHNDLVRFVVQHVAGEWEKNLAAHVKSLAAPLDTLSEQIGRLQLHQAEVQQTYEKAVQRRKDLSPALAYWKQQRDAQPASDVQEREALLKEIEEIEQELKTGNPKIAEIQKVIEQGKQERAFIENALASLDQQIVDAKREMARKVVESAQIVGATLTSLYLSPVLLNQEWDVVIVDEGSMAPPPAVLVAANRAKAHLIVVGDPLQLAPVNTLKDPNVKSWRKEDDIVQRWLGCDVFLHGGYTLEEADTGMHHSVLLPYQGRMHTQICDLIRGPVYKGRLKDRNTNAPWLHCRPEPEYPVVLYDTSGKLAQARKPQSGRSRYNPYHAEIAISLARLALLDLPEAHRKPECLGIVTPYAAQRDYIKERLQGTDLERLARVGTVHTFQGLEFDIVIFDLVESPGLDIALFLKQGWGTDTMRLLNVAVTRAREKLILVANMRYIREQQPPRSMLRQILELAYRKKCIQAECLRDTTQF